MTTEHQREQAERKHLIGVAVPRTPGLTEEQKAKLEKKIAEAKASSLMDRAQSDLEIPGRFNAQSKSQITGATPAQQWPKMPGYWAWADMGQSPTFGVQLTDFGVSQTSVQTEKKR
jgi:hypothetical protein